MSSIGIATSTLNSSIENLNELLLVFSAGLKELKPDSVCPQGYQTFFEYMYNKQGKQITGDGELNFQKGRNEYTRTDPQNFIKNKFNEILNDEKNTKKVSDSHLTNCEQSSSESDIKVKFSDANFSFRDDIIHNNYKKPLQKRFRCDQDNCGKTFYKRSHLVDHQALHTPPNFRCPHKNCSCSFSYSENLDKHLRMHENKQYRCAYVGCGKSFSSLFNYQVILNNLFF
jgi:hypothetical protein